MDSASEIDRCLLCPAHLPLEIKLACIDTKQQAVMDNQKSMVSKLDEIKEALIQIKMVAFKDHADTVFEIEADRIKIKPFYWIFAVAGTAIVSGLTNLFVKWVAK
jgi:hypothetical protein